MGFGPLTTVGVAARLLLLQMGNAVETAVGWSDILGAAGDGCVCHGRVGVRGLVHGLEL